jgi:transcriptional regulator GlxA family with amidase domain
VALSTFRRHFFAETGLALHRYVVRLRVERARRLLLDTELTTEAVADATGFADVFYFTRCFKAAVGIPPAHYRRTRIAWKKAERS